MISIIYIKRNIESLSLYHPFRCIKRLRSKIKYRAIGKKEIVVEEPVVKYQ